MQQKSMHSEATALQLVLTADPALMNIVWLSLFEAARLSIEHKAAICFE